SSDVDSVPGGVLCRDLGLRCGVLEHGQPGLGARRHVAPGRRYRDGVAGRCGRLTDVIGDGRVRALNDAWLHAGGNIVIVLVQIYNWYARYSEGAAAVVPTGFILSLIVVLGLLFTGWKGWEMVYRHRVGVADETAPREQTFETKTQRAA